MGIVHLLFLIVFGLLRLAYAWGRFSLKPLDQANRNLNPRTQFIIADIYVLLGQLALLGVLAAPAVKFMFVFWPLFIWWWWMGVKMLGRAGIISGRHRILTLLLTVPLGFGAPLCAAVLLPYLLFMGSTLQNSNEVLIGLGTILILLLCFILARNLARWAVASRAPLESQPDLPG